MSAISKKKQQEKSPQILTQSPEEILQRKRALESRVGDTTAVNNQEPQFDAVKKKPEPEPTGLAAEKAVGALCFLPKSIHRIATRAAEDRDLTAKRFFLETLLIGLEQQGVITREQRTECLTLPNEYGWKGRKQ